MDPELRPSAGIVGTIDVGVLLCSMLYGMTTVQTYIYAMSSSQDRRIFRVIVFIIWCLESLHLVFVFIYFWEVNIVSVVDSRDSLWSYGMSTIVYSFITPLVQAFFNYRIFVMSRNLWLAVPGWIFCALYPVATITSAVSFWVTTSIVFRNTWAWVVLLAAFLILVLDLWTSALLIWILRKQRGGYRGSDQIINRAIVWAMETGVVTCLITVLMMIFYVLESRIRLQQSILLFYGTFYSNSLLISLNTRMTRSGNWGEASQPRSHSIELSRHAVRDFDRQFIRPEGGEDSIEKLTV